MGPPAAGESAHKNKKASRTPRPQSGRSFRQTIKRREERHDQRIGQRIGRTVCVAQRSSRTVLSVYRAFENTTDSDLARFGKWALSELQCMCHMAEVRPPPRPVADLLCPLHPADHAETQSKRCRRQACPPSGKRACLPVASSGKRGRCPHQQSRGTNPTLRRAVVKALPRYRQ